MNDTGYVTACLHAPFPWEPRCLVRPLRRPLARCSGSGPTSSPSSPRSAALIERLEALIAAEDDLHRVTITRAEAHKAATSSLEALRTG